MKQYLLRLLKQGTLTSEETEEILLNITKEQYPQAQIASLLTILQMRGVTTDELIGFRKALMQTRVPIDFSPFKPIDIVGTGGDCSSTFNISTCACFVVAGAGYKVAKHGNYAATSVSGASSVLENHGVKFTNDAAQLKKSLEACNFVFLHAQLFARGMKFVGPVRKKLGFPTCFNLLGPLINPCRPTYQLLGVANLGQMRLYNSVLQKINVEYGIVNSTDGYDEISLTGPFKVLTRHHEDVLTPADLKLPMATPEELYGGSTPQDAMKVFDQVLENTSTEGQRNAVLVNAAFAIRLIENEKSIAECLAIARESLESGKALQVLKKYIQLNS